MDTLYELSSRIQPDKVFECCLEKGLIGKQKTCLCGGVMRLQKYAGCIDGFVFRCPECLRRKSVREGMQFSFLVYGHCSHFFSKSKSSLTYG